MFDDPIDSNGGGPSEPAAPVPARRQQPASGSKEPGGLLSGAAYAAGYGLSFGLAFPTLLLASFLPDDNALGRGLKDGAGAARRSVQPVRGRVDVVASATRAKVEGAYVIVAGGLMERVEAMQDLIAEQQHRRRSATG